jgi:hypothetical protein
MTYSRLQHAYLTAAENAVATLGAREAIIDTTNWKMIVHDGASVGGRFTVASEAYVQTQIATLSVGIFQNEYLFDSCE